MGSDSGLRTFFMTRNPRKVRLLSAESLWGYSELFGFPTGVDQHM